MDSTIKANSILPALKKCRQTFDTIIRMDLHTLRLLDRNSAHSPAIARIFFDEFKESLDILSGISNDDEYVEAIQKYSEELNQYIQRDIV